MHLIKIDSSTIGEEVKQTVNARDLHSFLEVGKDFSNWIKDRIDAFGFVENQDFVRSPDPANGNSAGLRVRIDYHLTLDMAKELSMVERNDKGKQARQYFIECERRAKAPALPADPIIMLRMEQLAMQKQVSNLANKTCEMEIEQESIIEELEATRRAVSALQAVTPKLTLGIVSNPITQRLHNNGLTVRQWAEKNGFEYSQVRNVISGLSQKAAIKRVLEREGYLSNDLF